MPQWDLANSDCILIMGSNMAENHPVAFRFVMQAKARGATVIHVDPRFTRTSALADIHAPIRSGTDTAFLGGIIRYILENDLWFKDYALNYTNLATLISHKFRDTSELDGFFSGWDEELLAYKLDSWQYRGEDTPEVLEEYDVRTGSPFSEQIKRISKGPAPQDRTLEDPFCVYRILRRHFAAYTPEMVSRVTGCPRDTFLEIARAIASNSGREKTGALCYAVAWTHHTTGVQIIRAAGILQALLGNIGRPGAGILALRGHCSIQGSTDIPTLYNMLPGYLAQPHAHKDHATFAAYLESETHKKGYWSNFPKFAHSLMRAWYGDNAGEHNQWGFQWIPKIMGDHSQLPMTMAMADGTIRGLLLIGQNPVIGGHNAGLIRKGLANLEWLVVRETFENETAAFWKNADRDPREIKTEVFMLPAAMAGEKDGTFTNTHRLVQWHDKVVDPPAHCRSDLWFIYHLGKRLKALYAGSTDPKDAPIRNLMWDYPEVGANRDPSAEAVLKEINGYTWPAREQLQSAQQLAADGSTACGAWIYTGVFPKQDHNQTRSRVPDGPDGPGSHLGWAFAWPANRRTLYNRASADSGRTSVVAAQALHLVECAQRAMGRPRCTRLSSRQSARLHSRLVAGPRRHGRRRRTLAVHHDVGRQKLSFCAFGHQGWPVARPFRTGGVAGAQPVLPAAGQSGGQEMAAPGQPLPQQPGSRISLRDHYLPADRTPLGRHSHPHGAHSGRTATRRVC
jgi:formate dehydrogenase major subunit